MTQLSKNIKIVENGDASTIVYTNINNSTSEIMFDASGVHINSVDITDAIVGVDPTPVVRSNNPIVGTATVNANIDALDAAIGATPTVVVRATNPITTTGTINANITALDAAIGPDTDLSIVTRTVGQVSANSSVMSKINALDDVIGYDAQMSGTPTTVSKNSTVYQNLEALGTYKTVRTVKVSIGNVGVTSCTQNATANANADEQIFTFTNLVPAKARIIDAMTITEAAFTNLGATTAETGVTSSGAELIAHTTIAAANAITAIAHAAGFNNLPVIAASNIYVSIKPTNQWDSANPVGKVSIYITFIDVTNV
jgi:hypothetical protein